MRIYIIRHGETARNREKVLQGRSDMPLNENGIRQAEQAGRWFRQHDIRFARAYASPLIRAVETARLAGGSDIITDDKAFRGCCFSGTFSAGSAFGKEGVILRSDKNAK